MSFVDLTHEQVSVEKSPLMVAVAAAAVVVVVLVVVVVVVVVHIADAVVTEAHITAEIHTSETSCLPWNNNTFLKPISLEKYFCV